MPSRRRRRSKNLGTNLAEVQRRLRYLERRPVRTKLQRNVVTTAAIAVNAVTPAEVSFGTTVITDQPLNTIENPKDGLLVINNTEQTTSVYSGEQNQFIDIPAIDEDARTIANGKNTIYYQSSPPSGGTYAVDDTWFDSDDGYKMYTWNGTSWSGFQLGNNAIASISATKITAGSLAADVIVTSNISAGQINAGNLDAARIATTALNANNITAGTISGITIKTSGSARRIEITNADDMIFYNNANTRMGTITSVESGAYSDPGGNDQIYVDDGILFRGGSGAVSQGTVEFPAIVASNSEVGIYGNNSYYLVDNSGTEVRGDFHGNYADFISFYSGYSSTNGEQWNISFRGPIIFDYDGGSSWIGEPISYGTGAPSGSGSYPGQIVFRYT